jgi:ABC-type phosphate/phosphonate transport system substrate-binding protein
MIASLPMYDRPETASANDRLWAGIRDRLKTGPETLKRDGDVWDHWRSPELILSQTCGYPYRAKLVNQVTMVGTPVYNIDCEEGHYFSVFVVRKDDPRHKLSEYADAGFAYNEALSQSGWAAPQTHANGLGFHFSNPRKSGGHIASAQMVAVGQADIAALDAVSWYMMQRWDDFTDRLRVLARTNPTPGLPLITALGRDPNVIRLAVTDSIGSLSSQDRKDLCLSPETCLFEKEAYMAVPSPSSP